MTRPILILIGGPPASGKSSLAEPLAKAFGLPLFAKDAIKERLADCFGEEQHKHANPIGMAAALTLVDIAQELLNAGQSVALESFFHKGKAEPELWPLTRMADSVLIHITAPDEVLLERYNDRRDSGDRHPVHEVGKRLEDLESYLKNGVTDPLDLDIPRLIVSTDKQFPTVEQLVPLVRELVGGPVREVHWP